MLHLHLTQHRLDLRRLRVFCSRRPRQLWVFLPPQEVAEEKKGKHGPTSRRYKQNKEKHKYNEMMEQYEKIKNLQLVADVSCRKESLDKKKGWRLQQ